MIISLLILKLLHLVNEVRVSVLLTKGDELGIGPLEFFVLFFYLLSFLISRLK